MSLIAYHGTKVDFDEFVAGTTSIDRMIGPHFSKTPALANHFALRNPGRKGNGKRTGGRVIRVRLTGSVYTLEQQKYQSIFAGLYFHLTHPETGGLLGLFVVDYHVIAYDIGKVVFPERPDLMARLAKVFGHPDAESCLAYVEKRGDWTLAAQMPMTEHRDLQGDIARAYKDILVARGYGVLQYVNTAKKEQVGDVDDQTCYIALSTPLPYFDELLCLRAVLQAGPGNR